MMHAATTQDAHPLPPHSLASQMLSGPQQTPRRHRSFPPSPSQAGTFLYVRRPSAPTNGTKLPWRGAPSLSLPSDPCAFPLLSLPPSLPLSLSPPSLTYFPKGKLPAALWLGFLAPDIPRDQASPWPPFCMSCVLPFMHINNTYSSTSNGGYV